MAKTLTVSAASGRISLKKHLEASEEGLELSIDFSSNSSVACTAFFPTRLGDLITSDSRGNITQFFLRQNRYSQHIRNVLPCSLVCQVNDEHVFLIKGREIGLYNLNGKKVSEFKQHCSVVKGFDFCYEKKVFLTYSAECAVVWDLDSCKVLRNLRSKGISYRQVIFANEGNSILTCFDDGKFYQWRVSDNALEKQFEGTQIQKVTIQEFGIFGARDNAEIFFWDSTGKLKFLIKAISGVSRILDLKSFQSELFVLGDTGRLYIINTLLWRIEFELQIGIFSITNFEISLPRLYIITNNGILHIYDYQVLSENSKKKNSEKLKKGLEDTLIFSYLEISEVQSGENHEPAESLPSLNSKEEILFTKLNPLVSSPSPLPSFSQSSPCQHDLFQSLFNFAKLTPHKSQINHCGLKKILQVKFEYPEKFRPLIWRFLLQLPSNTDNFAGLYSRGTHPDLASFFQNFKKKISQNEFSRTERVASALCYWSPLLSKVEYIGEIVNPFIKIYPGDDISCFEAVMALVIHWMQHWFECFPSPPVVLIESIANVIRFHDISLYKALNNSMGAQEAIWKVLKTLMLNAINQRNWMQLMDFLFTDWQEPEKIMFFVANFFLTHAAPLKKLNTHLEMLNFLTSKRKINVERYMTEVEKLYLNAGAAVISFNIKLPICQGQYPLFTGYPRFKVQTKQELAEEILTEMQERENTRNYHVALTSQIEKIQAKDEDFVKKNSFSNEDFIEKYHAELLAKRSYTSKS